MAVLQTLEEIAALLPERGRLLGFDFGSKTIGIAMSDPFRQVASPMETINRTKFGKDLARIKAIIGEFQIAGIVLGLPKNMDGSDGPRVQSTRTFASNLAREIDLPIVFWDERLSTAAVTRTLLDADASRGRRDALVDKMAAGYILQGALDRLRTLKG